MTGWPISPLVDLVQDRQISYGVVQPGNDSASGIPIVRVKDVRNGIIDTSSPIRVTEEIARAHSRTTLVGGELLLSLVGTVGESAVVPDSLAGWNVARAIAVIRPENVSSRWLQLCFESPKTIESIRGVLNTTVQATLNLSDLKQIPIPIPPEPVRLGIEEVVGALDDKIAANTKLAATSMRLAETYFRRTLHLAADERALGEILSLEYGKSLPTSSRVAGPIDVYGSGGITGSHNEALCPDPGVVIGRKGTAGAVHWSHRPFFPIDTTFYVVPSHHAVSQIFCYFLLRTLGLDEMNNDSAVPGLNRNQAHASRIMLPSGAALDEFTSLATKLFSTAAQVERENSTLVLTRDALLPQLMSGKLRVKEAGKVLENLGV